MSKTISKNSPSCQSGSSDKLCKFGLLAIQAFFTLIYAYTTYRCYLFGVDLPIDIKKPQGKLLGPLKYLTIWDVHFQLLVSFLNLLVLITNCSRLTSIRNALHHGLSFPFGVSVAGLFWSIYAIDRQLIFPKELEPIVPPLVNHLLHSLVAITPLINEVLMYNERKYKHMFIYYIVFICYTFLLLYFGYYLDFWIYPIFDHLNNTGRAVFIGFCAGLSSLIYLTIGALHHSLWNEKIKDSKKKKA